MYLHAYNNNQKQGESENSTQAHSGHSKIREDECYTNIRISREREEQREPKKQVEEEKEEGKGDRCVEKQPWAAQRLLVC